MLILLALGGMLGCQSVSASKQSAQTPVSGPVTNVLTPTLTSLTFSGVQAGNSQSQTETVQNAGSSNVAISQVTASGTGFSVSGAGAPLTLMPGQSTSFSVTFAPQSSGNYSGSVAIVSNASNSNLTVSLSGTATGQTGQAGQLSVSAVNVGSVTVGTNGTNTGTLSASGASVVVSSVSMGGTNPAEFSVSGLSFPVTVTTNQPVVFTVTFAPQASGGASANASFASNASNSPTGATLSGTGVAAPVHTVSLSWIASTSPNVVSYNIYRATFTSACGSYSKIGSSANTTYTDVSVVDGQSYCYEAKAVNSSDEESTDSNPVQNVMIPTS